MGRRRPTLVTTPVVVLCHTVYQRDRDPPPVSSGTEGAHMPTRAGSTQGLAEIVDKPVSTIAEVADRLGEVYEHARTTSTAGDDDGIGCFSGLYQTITRTIHVTPYEDPAFLQRPEPEVPPRHLPPPPPYPGG